MAWLGYFTCSIIGFSLQNLMKHLNQHRRRWWRRQAHTKWMWHLIIVKLVDATCSSVLLTPPLQTIIPQRENFRMNIHRCVFALLKKTRIRENIRNRFLRIENDAHLLQWCDDIRAIYRQRCANFPECNFMKIEQEIITINIKWPSHTIHIQMKYFNKSKHEYHAVSAHVTVIATIFARCWL